MAIRFKKAEITLWDEKDETVVIDALDVVMENGWISYYVTSPARKIFVPDYRIVRIVRTSETTIRKVG